MFPRQRLVGWEPDLSSFLFFPFQYVSCKLMVVLVCHSLYILVEFVGESL